MDEKLKQEIRDFLDQMNQLLRDNVFVTNPDAAPFYLGQAAGLLSRALLAPPPAAPTAPSGYVLGVDGNFHKVKKSPGILIETDEGLVEFPLEQDLEQDSDTERDEP